MIGVARIEASKRGRGDAIGIGPRIAAPFLIALGLLLFVPSAQAQVSFSGPTNFPADGNPQAVAVGDLNGDGDLDLATANDISENVSILLGDGAGGFSGPTNFPAGHSPAAIALGDFNGDGDLDLAVANAGSDVSILLGNGGGGFSGPTNFAAGINPLSVAVGDFNSDGNLDLAVANFTSNNVSILFGDGAGGFSAPTNLTAGTNPRDVKVGDFNGDGDLDLAVANAGSNDVSILLGNGAGGFSGPTNFPAGTGPEEVAVGDFDGDGNLDLAVANAGSEDVSILLGNGAGGFSGPTNFLADRIPNGVAVGDFNGDGRPDLAVTNGGSGNVSILLNTTITRPGTFSCRASAIRSGAGEPVVANPPGTPCVDDLERSTGFKVIVPGVSVSGFREALTDVTPNDPASTPPAAGDNAYAEATWQTLNLSVLGLPLIRADLLNSQARVTCVPDGQGGLEPAFTSSSRVVGLRVGLRRLGLVTNHLHVALPNGVTLHVNERIQTGDSITQRALWLHTPNRDVVIGEAVADVEGDPCG